MKSQTHQNSTRPLQQNLDYNHDPHIPNHISPPKNAYIQQNLQLQVQKIIQAYSRNKNNALTREEFYQLADDLLSTIDQDRKLTSDDKQAVLLLIDVDRNQMVTMDQLIKIVRDNAVK